MSYSDLKGKTFIVTGAASGMGRTTSLWLTNQGANVGLLDLRKPDNTLAEIEALGGKALSLACNVQDSKVMEESVKAVADHFGGLDGAANLAGYVGNQGLTGKGFAMDAIKDDDWDNMLATNLTGVKNSIKAELRHMKGTGSIVNAASIAGLYGFPWNAPYATAKWGVIGMTKCTAQEVGVKGIRVNAVAPGVVNTPLAQSLGSTTEVYNALVQKTALKRIAQPEEVSKIIGFLLSEESAYITAAVINVDGGYS